MKCYRGFSGVISTHKLQNIKLNINEFKLIQDVLNVYSLNFNWTQADLTVPDFWRSMLTTVENHGFRFEPNRCFHLPLKPKSFVGILSPDK